jgi:hypothetical protein
MKIEENREKKKKKSQSTLNKKELCHTSCPKGRPHRVDSKNTNENYFWLLHTMFEHNLLIGMCVALTSLHLLKYYIVFETI